MKTKQTLFGKPFPFFLICNLVVVTICAQSVSKSEAVSCIAFYASMGEEMFDKGQYDSTLYYFKETLPYCKITKNHQVAVNSINWITYLYNALGKTDSLEHYLKVAESHANELAKAEPCAEDLYKYYNTYARFYETKREIVKKLDHLKKAHAVLECQVELDTSLLIYSYQNQATVYENIGDHYTALEYVTYAEQLLNTLPKEQQKSSTAVSIFNTTGFQQMHLSNYEAALKYYEKALGLAEILEQENMTVVYILENLGYLHFENGNYIKASKLLRKAIRLLEQLKQEKHYAYATCQRILGQCAMRQGEDIVALQFLNKAKQQGLQHQRFKSNVTSGNFKALADYCRKDDPDLALDYYQKALASLVLEFNDTMNISANPNLEQTCYSKPRFLEILEAKGSLLLERGCYENALLCYRGLDELMFDMRRDYQGESSKFLLQKKAIPIYEKALQVALLLNKPESALQFSERSKAVLLLEATKDKNARNFVGLPESLLQQENEYKRNIAYLERVKYDAEKDPVKIAALDSRIFLLSKQKQELVERLEKEFPRYYNYKYADAEIRMDNLQADLEGDEAMLHYFYGEEKLYVFSITKDKVDVNELGIDAALEDEVYKLLENIERTAGDMGAFLEYGNTAAKLYDFLLKKSIAQFGGNITKLRIIPDGALCYLPFQVLLKKFEEDKFSTVRYDKLDYLVYDFSISYSYSSSVRKRFLILLKI